jgi:hypothetical protein
MKKKWMNVLKIIGVAAGGAMVADPSVQQIVQSVVPPPWNVLVGVGFGIGALLVKPPSKAEPAVPAK